MPLGCGVDQAGTIGLVSIFGVIYALGMATPVKQVRRNRASAATRNAANSATASQISWLKRITAWLQTTLGLGLLGSLLMYLALPPCNLWPLAWVAPVPWLLLCRQVALAGRRPYRALWVAGFMFWMGAIHWLRLPHWLTYFGWVALSFYLAFYIPVFVGLVRVAVHRLGISIVLAAPLIWTGLELAKGHLLGGFTMGSLEHTQIRWLTMIQGADIVGGYGIGGLMMFAAACLARMIPWPIGGKREGGEKIGYDRITLWPTAPLAIVLSVAIGYGYWRMSGQTMRPGPTVALIQGSIEMNFDTGGASADEVYAEYRRTSEAALAERPNLSLLVWPETMYRYPLVTFGDGAKPPDEWLSHWSSSAENLLTPELLVQKTHEILRSLQSEFQNVVNNRFNATLPPPLLLGLEAIDGTNEGAEHFVEHIYNSAQFVDAQGQPLARYDKMHPVMFGEYIPLAEYIPFLYKITPLTGGLTVGAHAVSQELAGVRYAPDVCYETVIPHLIRRQVLELRQQGQEPDVLVNVTNDGWFRGSSELDMHLACGVFRAIEMRKPLVISANTGISAWIDSNGRVVQQAQRMKPSYLIADVQLDDRHSLYLDYGDWFSGLCLMGCLGLAIVGLLDRRKSRQKTRFAAP